MDLPHITRDAMCWPSVETWVMARIDQLRDDLETVPSSAPGRVAEIQGRIASLRELIQAAEPEQPHPMHPTPY